MKLRKLGSAGFDVSEVGLGCWQLGSDWGAPLAHDTGLEILAASVDAGVRFFDTANVYGMGKSESLVGDYLRQTGRKDIRVATKYGRGDVYPDGYSQDDMRKAIDASRERLGVDCLDLVQLHCVPLSVLKAGKIFDWLRALQDEGAIRHFGTSVESIEEALVSMEQPELLSLQVIFNLYRQKLVTDLLPKAADKGVGIIVRLPLASGLLSGKFSVNTQFADNDHRNFNKDGQCFNVGETFAGLPFEKGVELTDALKDMLPEGMNMAEMAQRWILDHEAVSTIIPGASHVHQAANNASISDLDPLPADLHEALSRFYQTDVADHIRGPY